ncbi:MAG: type II toxin-antitoxin system VapC family toxin [Chthoniobacterales bacterium]|nr:type II toxin-antitoxin system VapC family toxin [Chthoniobacterales bacterium]
MRVFLDTCTFLWLALEPGRLSATACAVLDDPGVERCLSRVSVMEIVLKHRAGKLPLPTAPADWIPSRRGFFQITDVEFGERAIYRSDELPGFHEDPFDRLLAAHAIETGATLLSPDAPLSALGAARLW